MDRKMIEILLLAMTFMLFSNSVLAENEDRINKAVETLRILCLAGDSLEIKLKGNASLSILKKGIDGEIEFTKTNKNGVVSGLEKELLAGELENIRDCIEPRIDRILDLVISGSGNTQSSGVQSTISKIPVPQLWEGEFTNRYGAISMRLYIEKIDGDLVIGQTNWPKSENITTRTEGDFVKDKGSFSEQSKWGLLEGDNSSNSLIKFTNKTVVKGRSGVVPQAGIYYAYVTKSGIMKGIYFDSENSSVNSGKFTLVLQP